MSDPNDKPKIIIDDDWKEQAQREKEELDRQSREAREQQGIPEPSILEIAQILVMQASIGLGGMQDPSTGQQIPPSLPLAKHYIDLLDVLRAKTVNNLDEEEKRVIEGTLHELRMAFVQIASGAMGAGGEPGIEHA